MEPRIFGDDRGFFFESFNQADFQQATGLLLNFVQDNHSKSAKGVLRGLHYQCAPHEQGKLVRVVQGEVLDVCVDIRPDSHTRGQYFSILLSAENKRQLWIPPGFAHGFHVRTESAEFLYKTTRFYEPAYERCIRWDDPALRIDWQLGSATPILSAKDQAGMSYAASQANL